MQFKLTKEMTERNTALIKDSSLGSKDVLQVGAVILGFYLQLRRPVVILIVFLMYYIMNIKDIKIHSSKETLALTLLNLPFWCIQVAVFLPRPYYFSFSVVRKRKNLCITMMTMKQILVWWCMSLCSFLVCQYLAQSSQSSFVAKCCMLQTKMMISHLVKLYNRWFCLLFFFLFVISTKR